MYDSNKQRSEVELHRTKLIEVNPKLKLRVVCAHRQGKQN